MKIKPNLYQLLHDGINKLGLEITNDQTHLIFLFIEELKQWNKQFNLTSITDDKEIIIKHILDSISILSIVEIQENAIIADVGTGAGFPGLPIKIMRPDLILYLIEASQKKVVFLNHIKNTLALENTFVINERAEDFARKKDNREKFDFVVSRAVGEINALAEYSIPLLKIGGKAIFYKAKSIKQELDEAIFAIEILGGCIEQVANIVVPFLNAERSLAVIRKIKQSPQGFPRKAGIPAKRPLKK